jgi:hypothetical protein
MQKSVFIESIDELHKKLLVSETIEIINRIFIGDVKLQNSSARNLSPEIKRELHDLLIQIDRNEALLTNEARSMLFYLDLGRNSIIHANLSGLSLEILSVQSNIQAKLNESLTSLFYTLNAIESASQIGKQFLIPHVFKEEPEMIRNSVTFRLNIPDDQYINAIELSELLYLLSDLVKALSLYISGTQVEPQILTIDSGSGIDITIGNLLDASYIITWLVVLLKVSKVGGRGIEWLMGIQKNWMEIRKGWLEIKQKSEMHNKDLTQKDLDNHLKLIDIIKRYNELEPEIVTHMLKQILKIDPNKPYGPELYRSLAEFLGKYEVDVDIEDEDVMKLLEDHSSKDNKLIDQNSPVKFLEFSNETRDDSEEQTDGVDNNTQFSSEEGNDENDEKTT